MLLIWFENWQNFIAFLYVILNKTSLVCKPVLATCTWMNKSRAQRWRSIGVQRTVSLAACFAGFVCRTNFTENKERWTSVDLILDHRLRRWSIIKPSLGQCLVLNPAYTKHLYNICTMLDRRLRRWSNIVQILYKCFVFSDLPGIPGMMSIRATHTIQSFANDNTSHPENMDHIQNKTQ